MPAWLVGMTVVCAVLVPAVKLLFPRACKERGAFLLAFELACAGPVRGHKPSSRSPYCVAHPPLILCVPMRWPPPVLSETACPPSDAQSLCRPV